MRNVSKLGNWFIIPIVLFVLAVLLLEIYVFWHSKQANFGLFLAMIFGAYFSVRALDELRAVRRLVLKEGVHEILRVAVVIGFVALMAWFFASAFWVKDSDTRVLMALGPVVVAIVLIGAYGTDIVAKDRHVEQNPEFVRTRDIGKDNKNV